MLIDQGVAGSLNPQPLAFIYVPCFYIPTIYSLYFYNRSASHILYVHLTSTMTDFPIRQIKINFADWILCVIFVFRDTTKGCRSGDRRGDG